MSSLDVSASARQGRRKARTRAALISAAQHLIAEGGDAQASIQAITDLADVGFGSFYNYFSSKEDLFAAAINAAIDDYLSWLDERLTPDVDPVTRLVENIRHSGRLALDHPRIAVILSRRLALPHDTRDPRAQRIRADIDAAIAAAGVAPTSTEFDTLATAALGAITAVLGRAVSLSPAETDAAAEVLAAAVLRLVTPQTPRAVRATEER